MSEKALKAADLASKSEAELTEQLHKLLREQFDLRMQRASGQLEKTHLFKIVRKNIARVKTQLNSKQGA
jgi:large subunit ribosomal protein L29